MKKYFYLLMLCNFFLCNACSQKENKGISNKQDSCVVTNQHLGIDSISIASSKKYIKRNEIVLNRAPTRSDIDEFVRNGSSYSYNNLSFRFLEADSGFEILIYALIAVDKFHITHGYYEVACCLTNCLSSVSVGDHSEMIALHYLQLGSSKDSICSKAYKTLRRRYDSAKLWLPEKDGSIVKTLKINTLLGSVDDYNRLKKILHDNDLTDLLLYYSYIMADRYHYALAKKDIRDILERAYKKYGFGEFGEETKYFCAIFEE